jgi:hypothetical protein
MKDFLVEIRTNAWRTSGARYNASRRLKRRELISTISLAIFSSFTVALAFMQKIYAAQPGSRLDNYLTALSACLGIFLLAISLVEWGVGAAAKADALHRNAEDLNSFQRKILQRLTELASGREMSWSEIDGLRAEYDAIKERCSYNHDPIDDLFFRAEHRESVEFKDLNGKPQITDCGRRWSKCKYFLSSVWYFGIFWVIILTFIALTPW